LDATNLYSSPGKQRRKGDRLQLRKSLSSKSVPEASDIVELWEFNVLQLKDDSKIEALRWHRCSSTQMKTCKIK
jgi:hypothetical protein